MFLSFRLAISGNFIDKFQLDSLLVEKWLDFGLFSDFSIFLEFKFSEKEDILLYKSVFMLALDHFLEMLG